MTGFQLFNQTYVSDLYDTHIQIYSAATHLENYKCPSLHNLYLPQLLRYDL
jgi:hypothetical protein